MDRPREDRDPVGLIASSSLFDEDWYAAEVRVRFADRPAAIRHYVDHAGEAGPPHPLFSAEWAFPGRGWVAKGVDPLSQYLRSPKRLERAPHPLLHLGRITEADPRAAEHALGPADHWLRHAPPDARLPSPRGALSLSLSELIHRAADTSTAATPAGESVVPHRTTVVLPLLDRPLSSVEWLFGTFREHSTLDLELLVVVPEGSPFLRVVTDVARAVRSARVMPVGDGSSLADAANTGLAAARGDVVVFLSTQARAPYWPWIGPLRDALEDGVAIAQPLLLAEDHTIAAAGITFLMDQADRTPLLTGLAAHDAERLPDGRVPGVGGVAALRRDHARALGGLDTGVADAWAISDLGVRAWRAGMGGAVLAPGAQLLVRGPIELPSPPASLMGDLPVGSTEAWASSGLDSFPGEAGSVSLRRMRLERVTGGPARLRWTIDLPVTAGPWGRVWGDRYFGEALARALERRGQHVTIDPRESRGRATRDLDDVVLVIRGRDRVAPTGSPLHALWVISHPDDVTAEEASAFDLVFAASEPWAQARTRDWGVDVRPLLQCTDPDLFNPGLAEPDGHPLLFVGNARGSVRPAVAVALEAGLRPAIYGSGWEGLVDPALVVAEHVDNTELGRLYASAGVVLNDHWDDMREHGFISNRVFDVLACGTPVVSDAAAGLEAVGGVHVFRSASALGTAVDDLIDAGAPGQVAGRVGAEETFADRAEVLIDAVCARLPR